ncbi:uncharacterized protein M6B38_340270 [Iris pallida]|uniref:Uncharacterized protein n=1 Tax=Iris pallida TaxID=29817 RepID=A0AAX6GX74_IRIPA|nr:uncharacterized protein M6B38_340270 [Iris pallida]
MDPPLHGAIRMEQRYQPRSPRRPTSGRDLMLISCTEA